MAAPGVYVYAFVRAGHPLPADVRGVGDTKAPVRLLPCGELAAVIGPVPETLRARRRDLMAHQRLLSDLVPGGPVLPMRFGAIAPGETAVLDGAKARSAEYLAALESVEGRLEMNLKVMPAEDSLSDLVREDPRVRQLREEVRSRPGYEVNVRLGEAVVAGMRRRAAHAAEQISAALAAVAAESQEGPDVEGCVRNVSFLVARGDLSRFNSCVDRLSAEYRQKAALRVTGPLPCYSFVPTENVPAGV
ncbi:GvpL/GvpF family gas vesicle protein [Streptomyces sp. NBC_00344]|uniref:GvpL/GvpF family gas vesicle protein n=1 Tax=Streptomyces sp. NBC_00344 TaxID=2975720 RepID=UPI002E1B3945